MTRSMMIVNTSNWEHEDYKVTIKTDDGKIQTVLLKPSEFYRYYPHDGEVMSVEKIEDKEAVPYYLNGDYQVLPEVHVGFGGGKEKRAEDQST